MAQKTHWKKLHNPDYLGAYSLDDGQGGYKNIIVRIKNVKVEMVTGTDGKKEECTVAYLDGQKPMILNATNLKTLEKLFKSPYIEDWAEKYIQIGVEKVKAFGEMVDSLRIKKFHPKLPGLPRCADTGNEIVGTEKMTAEQIVAATMKRFGRPLCAERWVELVEAEKAAQAEPAETEQEALTDAE